MSYVTEDWILEMQPEERLVYLEDTDALNKVKAYNGLPNTDLMSTGMVAEWFEVTDITIRNLFNLNREELEDSGAKTLRGEDLKILKETVNDNRSFGNSHTTFPPRAVLNVALLLRKSETAKEVRLAVLGEELKVEIQEEKVTKKKTNLEMQVVDFNGDSLMAIKTNEGKIFTGVKWISEGIGLSDGQSRRQVENLKSDIVLSQGVANLRVPTNSGVQEVLCVELDFLPLWLAKISITPKMQKDSPEVVSKLVDYQLKAKNVLARVFVDKESYIIPTSYKEALQHVMDKIEENEQLQLENEILQPKADFYDETADAKGAELIVNTAKVLGVGEFKMFEFLREIQVLYKEGRYSIPRQKYLNSGYFEVTTGYRNLSGWHEQTFTTRITEDGKRFIYRLVKKYGGGSAINSLKMNEIKDYVRMKNQELGYKKIS